MADQRIQYTELMVGAGHPTKADTLNRLALVGHNTDGSHKMWVDVKEAYGAVGDGVTDDTTAISDALANARQIIFPYGTYPVTGDTLTG
ncbi:MAG: glycosyl hydrolase family 28-related protein, partial [Deltaproteobacteria bacterium]|nr:glycosyl hydrolase family 28-related protein [Deltaproteobacteria bacterium]